jgi:(p)ppGpp synthase/HD superfamily hydrolase
MSDILAKAKLFATAAHRRIDHRRRYTQEPYEVHPNAVASLVASVSDDPHMIAAAWLHDTVEDTPTTLEDLAREFGPDVASLVAALTDVSRPSDGNRAARKAIDRAHLAAASPRAKTIKLADLIDNVQDIGRHDPGFARVYLGEMRALLEVLGEGDGRLLRQAQQTMNECAQGLGLAAPLDPGIERAPGSPAADREPMRSGSPRAAASPTTEPGSRE